MLSQLYQSAPPEYIEFSIGMGNCRYGAAAAGPLDKVKSAFDVKVLSLQPGWGAEREWTASSSGAKTYCETVKW